MSSIEPKILKGMRDFLPEDMRRRKYVMNIIEQTFLRYGFEPCETPAIEYAEILEGKYGEEEKLLYRFEDQGERRVALKFDLTVPLARLIAMYQNQIAMPFKRYQMQPVYRAEKPQKGRYREFYQCDVDIVGSESSIADAELIILAKYALTNLGFEEFTIRINHRKLLRALAIHAGVPEENANSVAIAIDKLDKIGPDGVRQELLNRNISAASADTILTLTRLEGTALELITRLNNTFSNIPVALEALNDLEKVFLILQHSGLSEKHYAFDLTLARGLGYYTGPIFEINVTRPKIGSIGGGGRYDGLIGMFQKANIPATGISLGLERIIDVMTELNMFPEEIRTTQVLITLFDDDSIGYAVNIASRLRSAGINTEMYYQAGKLKKQFTYADKKGIQFVVIVGPDEQQNNSATLKDMKTGEQVTAQLDFVIEKLKALK